MNKKLSYPRLKELNIPIYWDQTSLGYVKNDELEEGLKNAELDIKLFNELFGAQTCPVVDGKCCLYPHDAEAVLERMMSGKLTGTQLFWD